MQQPRNCEKMPPIVMKEVIYGSGLDVSCIDRGESLGNKPPFLVSAHHLIAMGMMLREELAPAAVIERDVALLEEHRNRPLWKLGGRRRRHANDLLGSRTEQEIKYKKTGTDFLENFNALDDEDQVKIGNGQKDWWAAEGTATGDYSSRYYKLPPFRVMNDPVIIDVFMNIAMKLGIEEDKLQFIYETAVYSNRKKLKPVKSLLTTAGVVREVISSEEFQKEIHLSIRP